MSLHDSSLSTPCIAEEPLHFALLLTLTGPWVLRGAGAAALAVERVNADKALLPGHRLEYSWADAGCSATKGLTAMGEVLARGNRVDAVIGPGCSAVCEVTSYLAAGQGIPQISWGMFVFLLLPESLNALTRANQAVCLFMVCCRMYIADAVKEG